VIQKVGRLCEVRGKDEKRAIQRCVMDDESEMGRGSGRKGDEQESYAGGERGKMRNVEDLDDIE
jgi:hypothetical protein